MQTVDCRQWIEALLQFAGEKTLNNLFLFMVIFDLGCVMRPQDRWRAKS